jgi:hypothetical protein
MDQKTIENLTVINHYHENGFNPMSQMIEQMTGNLMLEGLRTFFGAPNSVTEIAAPQSRLLRQMEDEEVEFSIVGNDLENTERIAIEHIVDEHQNIVVDSRILGTSSIEVENEEFKFIIVKRVIGWQDIVRSSGIFKGVDEGFVFLERASVEKEQKESVFDLIFVSRIPPRKDIEAMNRIVSVLLGEAAMVLALDVVKFYGRFTRYIHTIFEPAAKSEDEVVVVKAVEDSKAFIPSLVPYVSLVPDKPRCCFVQPEFYTTIGKIAH